ncbi:MAG: hypothetical protein C0518_13125 [Opitutus sp.]|nr:hypothetical protein [Opitutus sp.]
MKKLILLCAVSAGLLASGFAQSSPPPQLDPYRQAVNTYVEAAIIQMQAYRSELDAAVKAAPNEKERFQSAYALVKRGEELINRLRSAAKTEFDAVKSMYERNRVELDRAMGKEPASG